MPASRLSPNSPSSAMDTLFATKADVNPSVALFGACKILLHKVRLEGERQSLLVNLAECESAEKAAARARDQALKDIQRAEEVLAQAKQALIQTEESLKSAEEAKGNVQQELATIEAQIEKTDADFEKEERVLGAAYKAVQEVMKQQGHVDVPVATPAATPTKVPTTTLDHGPSPNNAVVSRSLAADQLDGACPPVTADKDKMDEPDTPTAEQRSDRFVAALDELNEQPPGEVYADGRTYFFVGDLTRIFSPDLKDPNKTGAAHSRTYGTVEGEYRQGVRKQAGRWIMTLEAFEAYVKPHLRKVRTIKY